MPRKHNGPDSKIERVRKAIREYPGPIFITSEIYPMTRSKSGRDILTFNQVAHLIPMTGMVKNLGIKYVTCLEGSSWFTIWKKVV